MKRRKRLPRWLKRLARVKAELRQVSFPRSAEEGFQQCMALSTFALSLMRDGVRAVRGSDGKKASLETTGLLARLSHSEARRDRVWRRDRVRFFHR